MLNQISVSWEDIINNMEAARAQKEDIYMRGSGFYGKDGAVVWKDDRIVGFRFHLPMECLTMTVKIN